MSFDAKAAVDALQAWYNPSFGLYRLDSDSFNLPGWLAFVASLAGFGGAQEMYPYAYRWWDSANAIGTLIDYMSITGDLKYKDVLDSTFTNAQNAWAVYWDQNPPPHLDSPIPHVDTTFPTHVDTPRHVDTIDAPPHKLPYTNFSNHYNDDKGWWALAWIKAYDLTLDQKYLNMAETIFKDMSGSWDNTFGGGIYWAWDQKSPDGSQSPYKNSIANELFMAVAARLYLRTKDTSYKTWAVNEYNWFIEAGLIKTDATSGKDPGDPGAPNLVYDSLDSNGFPEALDSNGKLVLTQAFWTYNCGVILHALCDLSIITGDKTYLTKAEQIADAAIQYFDKVYDPTNKTLTEAPTLTERNLNPSPDTCQFKGIFIRNLAALFANDHKPDYSTFITNNATSVLANGNASSQFGKDWGSKPPPDSGDFIRQSAAIDAINAAKRVLVAEAPISVTKTLALVGQKPPTGIRQVIGWLTPSVRAWVTAVTT